MIDMHDEGPHMSTTAPTPPITDALRAEARANPGSWIYAIDPGFEGQPEVPPQGIVGAWQADEKAWRRLWTRLAPDTEAVTEAGPWSIGQVESRIRALLADMGLATRVEYLWPTSPAAWDGSGRS